MAGTTADELYRMFQDAAGQQTAGLGDVRYALEEVVAQLGAVQQTATQAATTAQKASSSNSSSSSSGSSDSTFVQVLKSGLGIAPLVGGLISLFSGGSEEPPPLVKYALPSAVDFQAAESGGQITTADYNQAGMARAYPAPQSGSAASSSITVNVQAMDARSFLDRSGDIAAAVRDAMLNLNSINDVVNDL